MAGDNLVVAKDQSLNSVGTYANWTVSKVQGPLGDLSAQTSLPKGAQQAK